MHLSDQNINKNKFKKDKREKPEQQSRIIINEFISYVLDSSNYCFLLLH